MLVILIVASLLGIEAVRRQRQASLVAEHRYRLFQMRDRLREIAACNEAVRRSWVFVYLDSTTAKAINILPILSAWRLLAIAFVYRNDKSYEALSANLERELAKPQFLELKAYERELSEGLFAFLVQRHHTLHISVEVVDRVISPAKVVIDDLRKRSLDVAIKSGKGVSS